MRSIRQLVVHFGDNEPASRQTLAVATALARAQGARLSLQAIVESAASGAYLSPEAAALAAQLAVEQTKTLRGAAEAALQALADGLERELQVRATDPVTQLIEASRSADLLVLTQPEATRGLRVDAVARLLVQASCPVLVVPHVGAAAEGVGQSILLAWSGSRESARALADALPWLRVARRVELLSLSADAPPAWGELPAHLQRHGVAGAVFSLLPPAAQGSIGERLARAWSPDASVAETLLSRAADSGADLIVCGAYGHPRAWELVLGGVTRELLRSMTVPVLFSH